jgi:hypothetical protein
MEADNNPMLRDGLTGDWYVLPPEAQGMRQVLTTTGLGPSLDTKAQSTKLDSPPMRTRQQQLLQILLRKRTTMLFA